MTLEDRRKWRFITTGDDLWRWIVTDTHAESASELAFRTLKECIDDAKLHGYVPASPERRRNMPT